MVDLLHLEIYSLLLNLNVPGKINRNTNPTTGFFLQDYY